MIGEDFDREIARCEREIADMECQSPTQPAYLTTLGIQDWRAEKARIEAEKRRAFERLAARIGVAL